MSTSSSTLTTQAMYCKRKQEKLPARLAIAGTAATAFASEAISVFPSVFRSSPLNNIWFWLLIACTSISIVALLYFMRKIFKCEQKMKELGTGYYLRLLSSSMADRHWDHLEKIEGSFSEMKMISQVYAENIYYSAPPNVTSKELTPASASQATSNKVYDVCDSMEKLSRELERSMNEDASNTNFSLIPNMLFPMGIGLACQTLLIPQKTTLWELTEQPADGTSSELSWQMQRDPAAGKRLTVAQPNSSRNDNTPPPKAILLCLNNTNKISQDMTSDGTILVRMIKNADNKGFTMRAYEGSTDVAPEYSTAANQYAKEYAKEIWHMALEYPNTPILLAGLLPKTMQIALGWRLTLQLDLPKAQRGSINLWERIVPVAWSPQAYGQAPDIAYRINNAQPPVEEMHQWLETLKQNITITTSTTENKA